MKKTIIKIVILFSLLIAYCAVETLFLNHFTKKADSILAAGQAAGTTAESQIYYEKAHTYIENKSFILKLISPQNEWEMITAGLGRYRDYLLRQDLTDAVVAAGEIRSYLKQIR